MSIRSVLIAFAFTLSFFACQQLHAQSTSTLKQDIDKVAAKSIEFLRREGQAADGTFSIEAGPGVTALTLTALLRNNVPLTDPMLEKGLKALEGFVKQDGGIYGNGRIKNYETCVSILCFSEANTIAKDGRYDKLLANAKLFVTNMQYGSSKDDNPENQAR